MTEATYNRYVERLFDELNEHPYRDELLKLMAEQLADDTYTIN